MKQLCLALALAAAWLSPAGAQVTVEVTLPQEQFLPGEAIIAAVRVTNRSGQRLHLGAEKDWLSFSVESRSGFVVARVGDVPVTGEFDLDSARVATRRVDLAPYFTLSQPARYSVTATVKIPAWDREISSPPKGFDIIHGANLWEQEFGVPAAPGDTNATPEVRKYILQQANYLKGQLRLYLKLTDASEDKSFRVFPIGQMVSFSQPEGQVDQSSNLHVLYANGPHSYSYTVFNPDGDLVVRETFDYTISRPRLHMDQDGKISVSGGARRFTPKDLPSTKPATAEPPAAPTTEPKAEPKAQPKADEP
jgi:hypothetical protein